MIFSLFSEKTSCIIIAGGSNKSSVEVLTGDFRTKQLPNLPKEIYNSSRALHNGTILVYGGQNNDQKCLELDHGTWEEHSTLNQERVAHSAVTTQTATFLFGGGPSSKTYEYLPKNSTTWLKGKTKIPEGFDGGCAIAVKSEQEIWLIGGRTTSKRILRFSVKDHTFQEVPSQLNVERGFGHRCAFIPNTNKIMISGGYNDEGSLDSTEILDTKDGSVTMASPMNSKRLKHGMGVVTINGEERLAVLGGYYSDSVDNVELYNNKTEKWETTDIKLKDAKSYFGFLTVKLADVVSHLA